MNSSDSHPRLQPSSAAPVFRSTTEIFEAATKRCFSVSELIHLLSPATPLDISCLPPSTPPPSGALFLYDRSTNRYFKQDGHDWVKKRVSRSVSTLKVREDDVKLRLNGQFRVAGWYARSATKKTFRRRTYYLLNPVNLKALNDLVLVHYLDKEEALKGNSKGPTLIPAAADEHERGGSASASLSDVASRIETKVVDGSHGGTLSSSHRGLQVQTAQKSAAGPGSVQSNRNQDDTSNELLRTKPLEGSPHVDEGAISIPASKPGFQNNGKQQGLACRNSAVASVADVDDARCIRGGNRSKDDSFCMTSNNLPPSKTRFALSDFQAYPKLTESDVAREWASSSESEKCAAIADLYGSAVVDAAPNDSKNHFATEVRREVETLRMSILEDEINKIRPDDKSSFLEAMRRCPSLALSNDIKLQFLRCEDDAPHAAARRLVDYWTMRLELFGPDHAFSALTLEAAFSDEWEEKSFGFARLLPGTDASGRAIIFTDNAIRCGGVADLRSIWYMVHAVLEDKCAKRNGYVWVHFNTPSVEHADREAQLQIIRLINLLPLQLRGIHACRCAEQSWFRPISDTVKEAMGKHIRARRVFHEGSVEFLALRLAEFGISRNQLPTQMGGDWTEDCFRQWLELRRAAGR